MMQKVKQEETPSDSQKIIQLQKDIHELRLLIDRQSDQLAKQQKLMQLIQFSWLTFFFVVFNLILLGVFVALFIKDKGE
jgi:hypothetical protein